MSTKVSRRSVLKFLGVTGAALAAAPLLAKASAFSNVSGPQKGVQSANLIAPSGQQSAVEPLVLYVRGDQIVGFRGLDEIPVNDASLAGMLNSAFSSSGGSS
jgi:hypothetical protein